MAIFYWYSDPFLSLYLDFDKIQSENLIRQVIKTSDFPRYAPKAHIWAVFNLSK